MSRDTCLKRHLLHAAVQAYHPTPPFYSGPPRWTAGPVAIAAGRSATPILNLPGPGIDYALVGRFDEGIVVAFRGTLPPLDLSPDGRQIVIPAVGALAVALDWVNNLSWLVRGFTIGAEELPGTVHRGFATSLARLWGGVAAEIDRLRGGDSAPRLYFTGHSKGGALANLAAARARQAWPDATLRAATFGAPRPGDGDFARAYLAAGIGCHRYEVAGDPVPRVPRRGLVAGLPPVRSCEPVGTPHSLAATDRDDDPWLLPDFVAAHLPYPGFGYGENVCEADCSHDWR